MEVNGKVGAIGSLYPEVLDELGSVLLNIRVHGHEKIDRISMADHHLWRNRPLQLKLGCFSFVVPLSHQLMDQICILTILKRLCVEAEIHIQRADMGLSAFSRSSHGTEPPMTANLPRKLARI